MSNEIINPNSSLALTDTSKTADFIAVATPLTGLAVVSLAMAFG